MDANITRVDLETLADGVMLKYWRKGWKEQSAPSGSEVISGTVFEVCKMLDQQGFTVHMENAHKGRALRGEITRIDFIKLVDGWKVSKYPYGWTASTRPIEVKIYEHDNEFYIETALKWCTDHGWTIRQWNERLGVPAGYRAFRDRPQPVRDARMIVFMRNKMPNVQLDFAYDC